MFTTFALSNIIGVQVVLGVSHALHSPLMAVTNAISGTTALGGMHLFAHSHSPGVTTLAALATSLSTVNIVGEWSSPLRAGPGTRPPPAASNVADAANVANVAFVAVAPPPSRAA